MILFYEDEKSYLKEHLEALDDANLEYKICKTADEFMEFLKERQNYDMVKLFIIDIMVFGPGNEFEGIDTQSGYSSGIALLVSIENIEKNIFKVAPKRKIIFTNRAAEDFKKLKSDNKVFAVLHKSDYLPSEFLDIVRKAINNS